jgi:hypothetical protein
VSHPGAVTELLGADERLGAPERWRGRGRRAGGEAEAEAAQQVRRAAEEPGREDGGGGVGCGGGHGGSECEVYISAVASPAVRSGRAGPCMRQQVRRHREAETALRTLRSPAVYEAILSDT